MEPIKVLIADDNEDFGFLCSQYLYQTGMKVVGVVGNGSDAMELTIQQEPDVVVVDLIMPVTDGIYYLSELETRKPAKRPVVIVTSCVSNSQITSEVLELGADYYMMKPYDHRSLVERILTLTGNTQKDLDEVVAARRAAEKTSQGDYGALRRAVAEAAQATNVKELESPKAPLKASVSRSPIAALGLSAPSLPLNLEEHVTSVLHEIGVPAHIKGYRYLRTALLLAIEDKGIINSMTKQLYPTVADTYSTTPSRVERAIRHAIEVAWDRGDVDTLNRIFSYTVNNTKGKPTNSEFISLISDSIRVQCRMETPA